MSSSLLPSEVMALLDQMNRLQVHRGPDDSGTAVDAGGTSLVGLGCTRLAIQDLSSSGHQPMIDTATRVAVILNGEIYNFKQLAADLIAKGHRFFSESDTEVVLKAYLEWGLADAVRRFRGMFAIALWDPREAGLYLVRDRLGVKPLYFSSLSSGWVFASEVRTLVRSAAACRRVSVSGLCRYLALGAVQDPGTLVEGIRSVTAGSIVRLAPDESQTRPYWDIAEHFQYRGPADDVVARVRTKLEEAVRLRLISDAPTGVFLSGGIDSTGVTALAATHIAGLRTVSLVFRETAFSEKRFIDAVVNRYGTAHSQVDLHGDELLRLLPDAIAAMDQPTFDGINTYVIAKAAREAGLKVALSGIGGDELFGGYPSFTRVPQLVRLRQSALTKIAKPALAIRKWDRVDDQWRKLLRWWDGGDVDDSAYALTRELFGPSDRGALAPRTRGYRPFALPDVGRLDLFNTVSELELTYYLRNVLLRDADFMGMAHGLEIREPLLDHELVELVASLPGHIKSSGRGPKPLLVAALGDLIPDEVRGRRKMGFTLPFADWLRSSLRDEVGSVLRDGSYGGEVARFLDPDAVTKVWNRFISGPGTWTRPWALYVLKVWGQNHLASP